MRKTNIYSVVLFLTFCLSLNAESQNFKIHKLVDSLCLSEYKAYGSFLVRLEKLGRTEDNIEDLNLVSDSIFITKATDGTYSLCPMYENVVCKIFIINTKEFNIVDSLSCKIGNSAFFLKLTSLNVVHGFHTAQEVLSKAEKLFFYASDISCNTIKQKPKIVSYSLCLKRGNSIKAIINLKGEQLIPKLFKQKVLKIYEKGDELCAMSVFFKTETGLVFEQNFEPLYIFR